MKTLNRFNRLLSNECILEFQLIQGMELSHNGKPEQLKVILRYTQHLRTDNAVTADCLGLVLKGGIAELILTDRQYRAILEVLFKAVRVKRRQRQSEKFQVRLTLKIEEKLF